MVKPWRTLLIGGVFIVVGAVYWALSGDWGGTTMLVALGAATSLMTYVLVAGSPSGDDAA